jgi:hypothetical protein
MELHLMDMLLDGRHKFNLRCYKEVIIIACWALWNTRNKLIFENPKADQHSSLRFFKKNSISYA